MKDFKITYKEQDIEIYTEAENRRSMFLASLPTGPVIIYMDKDADGQEHWKEEEYGQTTLAVEIGKLIDQVDFPFMKK